MPLELTDLPDLGELEAFFGKAKGCVSMRLVEEWEEYGRRKEQLPADVTGLGICEFWQHPMVTEGLPCLTELARWYASFPSSNVSAERAFSSMRAMHDPHRMSLSRAHFESEFKLRINRFLLDALKKAHASKFRKSKEGW